MTQALIEALGLMDLPPAEQKEILEKVDKRLEDVLLRVVVENLSDEEVKRAREVLERGVDIEDEIAEITSGVPMLAEKMERAVAEEIDRLRKVLSA